MSSLPPSRSCRPPHRHPYRRAFLRGAGGIVLALPFLEYFAPRPAQAAPPPKRYVFAFGGTSIGFSGGDSVVPAGEPARTGGLAGGLRGFDYEQSLQGARAWRGAIEKEAA